MKIAGPPPPLPPTPQDRVKLCAPPPPSRLLKGGNLLTPPPPKSIWLKLKVPLLKLPQNFVCPAFSMAEWSDSKGPAVAVTGDLFVSDQSRISKFIFSTVVQSAGFLLDGNFFAKYHGNLRSYSQFAILILINLIISRFKCVPFL